jgi:hypothetical protein
MIEHWYAAVQRYPRQLQELDREEYVSMKLREYERMHAHGATPAQRTASSSP